MASSIRIENINEKLDACDTPADVLEMLGDEGLELSDDELSQISGGGWGSEPPAKEKKRYCPKCGSSSLCIITNEDENGGHYTTVE